MAVKVGHSLAERFPGLAGEWHPTKNGQLTPAGIHARSWQQVWWQDDLGHAWEDRVRARTGRKPRGCPRCDAGENYVPRDYWAENRSSSQGGVLGPLGGPLGR
ncbi:zinc-ribbon domain-containing protein [Demequina maris]|uniref:zinc-ribbon domain-containing protein n=1 Tax=Demequina maris TaxID=1638982 RepID=UPI000783B817|nr:zinc-ribbon domain-containing protein [Demequina maris]